jgi:hypothetical protein
MMKPVFRSAAFWQSALMTLPDDAFFELVRSVLGTVKTPFNKQKLLEELSRFVTRPEIQETMAAYIDGHNRRIITAVVLLGEPVPGELETFFTGEYSYAELHGMLLNLEERLILYRFRDGNKLRLALNPRLENILSPLASDPLILFPSIAESSETNAVPVPVDGRILAAVFAFLLNGEALFKGDTQGSFSFRKKTVDEGSRLFPGLEFETIAGGLVVLGLLVQDGEYLVPDEARIRAFKALSLRDCFEYLAAGIALFLQRGSGVYLGRSLLKNTVRLIHALMGYAGKEGRLLPEATMIKLAEMLRREEEKGWGSIGSDELPSSSLLIRSLVPSGLFTLPEFNGKRYYRPVPQDFTEAPALPAEPLIAMDSGFSCILYPGISFADALDLGAFSAVEETGTTVRFVLSRDSVVRGFDRGYGVEFLWQLLERLSAGRAGDTLKWNLEDWEKRYREVSLDEGTVLTLSGERSYLAQTEPLASMITKTLGPGIYFLSAGAGEASDVLHKAGVDIVARFRGIKPGQSQAFIPLEKVPPLTASLPEGTEEKSFGQTEAAAEQSKNRFRKILAGMKLARPEKEELESRIERGVVVSETQLKGASLRYEKLEARSLDYVGKTGIAKQAIASGSLLEVHWTAAATGEQTLWGIPESLDKKGGEMMLTIRPREGGESIRIALGKISLLRRIKQSIFGE